MGKFLRRWDPKEQLLRGRTITGRVIESEAKRLRHKELV